MSQIATRRRSRLPSPHFAMQNLPSSSSCHITSLLLPASQFMAITAKIAALCCTRYMYKYRKNFLDIFLGWSLQGEGKLFSGFATRHVDNSLQDYKITRLQFEYSTYCERRNIKKSINFAFVTISIRIPDFSFTVCSGYYCCCTESGPSSIL